MLNRIKESMVSLLSNSTFDIFIVLLILFAGISPFFLTVSNIRNIVLQNIPGFVMMAGIVIIMQGGGIDLSIDYQIALVCVILGKLLSLGINSFIAITVSIVVGMLCGYLNGIILTKWSLPPLAITLVTQEFFRGLSYMVSGRITYYEIPQEIRAITSNNSLMSLSMLILLISVMIVKIIFSNTSFGKYVLAMGCNEQVLQQNKINISKIKLICYISGSFFFSITAILLVSRQGAANSVIGTGFALNGVLAAYIAGVALNKSKRNGKRRVPMINFYLAYFILMIIENGMQLIGSNQYMQHCFTSGIVLVSIILSSMERKRQI